MQKFGNLVIVDDHKLFRKGLKLLLRERDWFENLVELSNGQEFLDYISIHPADIVLMDIMMPVMDGIEATQQAIRMVPDLKIIALTMLNNEDYYFKMIEAGAKGYLLKDADSEELFLAIKTVLNGQNYFSQDLVKNVINALNIEDNSSISISNATGKFSSRELEVLQQICKGYSNHEIADILFLSPRTVERHRANLFDKSGAKNSVHLLVYALKNNLVKI